MSSKESLLRTLGMLHDELEDIDQSIISLNQTLADRETRRKTIIDAIEDIKEMLKEHM